MGSAATGGESSPRARSSGYGILLGALGVGAIIGVSVLSRLRAKLSVNAFAGLAGGFFCVALIAVALMHSTIGDVLILLPTGATWVWMLATLNTSLQLFLPSWVRARGLSIYQMVLFGSQGLGALLWGVLANAFGLSVAFITAAGLLAASTASIRLWPLIETSHMDRSIVVRPDPEIEFEMDGDRGRVLVWTTYTIPPEREADFKRAMRRVRESRFRTGATEWGLFRSGEQLGVFEEVFYVASWEEHLRQHRERLTATDLSYEEEANVLSSSPPHTQHLFSTEREGD